MTLNKILIIGNVGRDPEMRYTPNGNPVTSFSVATSRRYTTQGEQREETEWFRVSAWNRLAETCNQYVTKGMKVFVEGRLSSSEWVGQDGEKRFGLEITASEVKFLNRPGDADGGDQGGEGGGGGYTPPSPAPNEVEDLPW
jgi:single-strand DNA-binding protein